MINFFGTDYVPLTEPKQRLTVYRYYDNRMYICQIKRVDYKNETFDILNLCDKKYHSLFQTKNIAFGDPNFYIPIPSAPDQTNDSGYYALAGEIIRDACSSYYAENIPLPQHPTAKQREKNKEQNLAIERGREVARLFFKKSRLFKLTNLNAEWLLKHYKDNPVDDDN